MSKIQEAIQENRKKTSALCLMLTDETATSYDLVKHVQECEERLLDALEDVTDEKIDEVMLALSTQSFPVQEAYRNGMCLVLNIIREARSSLTDIPDNTK